MAERPRDDAERKAGDAHASASAEERGADDREVVDDRRDGGGGEPPLRVEGAGRDGAEREEDRARSMSRVSSIGLRERGGVEAAA